MVRKTPTKKLLPKVLTVEQINLITQCSAARLLNEEIAAILNCSLEEFLERKETDIFCKNAYIRGRADMVRNCAAIVIACAQGTMLKQMKDGEEVKAHVTDEQLKAAQFYLEHHGDNWRKD